MYCRQWPKPALRNRLASRALGLGIAEVMVDYFMINTLDNLLIIELPDNHLNADTQRPARFHVGLAEVNHQ